MSAVKRKWVRYATLGVACYLLFLVATVPATWLAWAVDRASHGQVAIAQARGTLWHGHGALTVYYPRATPQPLGQIEWALQPLRLLIGQLQLQVRDTGPELQVQALARLSPGVWQLRRLRARLSTAYVRAFLPPARLFDLRGELALQADHLVLAADGLHGRAAATVRDVAVKLTPVQPLGSYRLELRGTGKTADLTLTTLNGALALNGTGRWQTQGPGQLVFNGTARALARPADLAPLMQLLGPAQGDGSHRLSLTTVLPLPGPRR